MDQTPQSRRAFLGTSGTMLGGSWIAFHLPAILATADFACQARLEGAGFDHLSGFEATELEAIAARIIPSDETPGAREAGVIHFIDRALSTFMERFATPLREGLDALTAGVRQNHPGVDTFSALPDEAQMAALREIETTPFFGLVRALTIMGMFADPSYGGNRDKAGWQLLGFEDRHAWQPPFGYYDARYANGGSHGADA